MIFKKPYHFCCWFLSFLWVWNDNVVHFWIALFMQITTMTLTQFQDNFWAKIFKKQQGGVKMKVNILMKVSEVCDLPLWMVTVLFGWWPSYLSGDYSFGDVNPPWQSAGLPRNGWSPSPEEGHQPHRVVTNLKCSLKNDTVIFTPCQCS